MDPQRSCPSPPLSYNDVVVVDVPPGEHVHVGIVATLEANGPPQAEDAAYPEGLVGARLVYRADASDSDAAVSVVLNPGDLRVGPARHVTVTPLEVAASAGRGEAPHVETVAMRVKA